MKCPNCSREIEHFDAECKTICHTQYRLDKAGAFYSFGTERYSEIGPFDFKCPKCGAFLTNDSHEARAMLLGKKALRRFRTEKGKTESDLRKARQDTLQQIKKLASGGNRTVIFEQLNFRPGDDEVLTQAGISKLYGVFIEPDDSKHIKWADYYIFEGEDTDKQISMDMASIGILRYEVVISGPYVEHLKPE